MKIHEYQAKELLRQYGVAVAGGRAVDTPETAFEAAREMGAARYAVKAQIHAGGRGKAGGVRLVDSPVEVKNAALDLLNKRLVTIQTGPDGILVRKVLVEESVAVKREYYLGMTLDRQKNTPVFLVSSEGGVEIEQVAKRNPEKILKLWMNPLLGLQAYQARQSAVFLGFRNKQLQEAARIFVSMSRLFFELDCSLVEINPFILTEDENLAALDAKITFDDNALFRHAEIRSLRDETQEDPLEVRASGHNLNYISLDGNIGCMVNGAGLAMATMDIIKFYGGMPANFLDVGGGASAEMVTEAFKILLSHPKVKGILVNIFGGIMKCDVIAAGIIEAARGTQIGVPLVVRLEGTNVDLGKKILHDSGLQIVAASSMAEAAQEIVEKCRGL